MQIQVEIPNAAIDAAISARVAQLTANLVPALPQSRPHFARANAGLAHYYRTLQCQMFGAARDAGCNREDRDGMIAAINATNGTDISSRTEMTPLEMLNFTLALRDGVWAPGWVMRRG